jgi:CubicO group peptidase (beta-lactamase class C family)
MKSMRPAPLKALIALLPALLGAGCSEADVSSPEEVPEAALAVIGKEPGAPREALAKASERLFTDTAIGETRALLVLHRGRVVLERYGEGYDADTRFIGWSMSKTVTAAMIGMLVADGQLQLDETPPIPNWQRSGDPRGEITLRQLLQMRSGLRHDERADPDFESDTVRMLFLDGRDDMARWAEAQPLEETPGRKFEYSTATSVILADIAARVLTDSQDPDDRRTAVDDFLRARIFTPLGMDSMVAEYDAAGTLVGGSMMHANARDWSKFGEFLRHSGSVKGAQLLPRGWISFMLSPSPRAPDYGAHVWLNRDSGVQRNVLFAEKGPADLFAAVGHLGQYVIVSPSQQLTVVRLGKTNDADRILLEDALGELVSLYPSS